MKKIFISFISFLIFAGTSCTDVLDQQAVDSFDEDVVFSDLNLVKAYVGACYSLIGGTKTDGNALNTPLQRRDMLTSSTDHSLNTMRAGQEVHLMGTLSPDNLGMFSNNDNGKAWLYWTNQYVNIQNLNTILERIDEVPVSNTAQENLRTQLKGEAYFLRALSYTHLLMTYGGVILTDKRYKMTDDFSGVRRSSIAATKDFILSDIANAISFLPATIEQGRASRGAAAAVKSRMLLFCSGKLANGGWAEQAGNELVSFPSGSQRGLLEAARDAAKEIIDGKYGNYDLYGKKTAPVLPLSEAEIQEYANNFFYLFYQKAGSPWHSETIWGIQHVEKDGRTFQPNVWYGPSGYLGYGNNNPTEDLVRRFEMADGSKFVWDAGDPNNKFTERKATAAELEANPLLNPYNGREPRFYASVLYHGAPWIERPAQGKAWDPYNRIQAGHKYRMVGGETTQVNGIDTRQAPYNDWNATKIGYYMKKYLDPEIIGDPVPAYSTHAWIEYRFAEVLLNYAEACIELGGADMQSGIQALNRVRWRAGLPGRVTTDQNEAREFVRHEREIELFGEGMRFFDMRRWMICDQVIVNVYPMIVKEYVDGTPGPTGAPKDELISMSWQLGSQPQDTRTWAGNHFYWLPIQRGEINKVQGLQQNPGYN